MAFFYKYECTNKRKNIHPCLYILLYKFFMVHQCRFGGLLGQICDSEYGAGAQSTAHPHHVYEIPPNPFHPGSALSAPWLEGDRMKGALEQIYVAFQQGTAATLLRLDGPQTASKVVAASSWLVLLPWLGRWIGNTKGAGWSVSCLITLAPDEGSLDTKKAKNLKQKCFQVSACPYIRAG